MIQECAPGSSTGLPRLLPPERSRGFRPPCGVWGAFLPPGVLEEVGFGVASGVETEPEAPLAGFLTPFV